MAAVLHLFTISVRQTRAASAGAVSPFNPPNLSPSSGFEPSPFVTIPYKQPAAPRTKARPSTIAEPIHIPPPPHRASWSGVNPFLPGTPPKHSPTPPSSFSRPASDIYFAIRGGQRGFSLPSPNLVPRMENGERQSSPENHAPRYSSYGTPPFLLGTPPGPSSCDSSPNINALCHPIPVTPPFGPKVSSNMTYRSLFSSVFKSICFFRPAEWVYPNMAVSPNTPLFH